MAEVTGLRNNALPYPIYAQPWGVVFPILDADGDLVTGATGLDSERSLNGDTYADCTNEATEIATSSGTYYLLLTAAEMTADVVSVIVKTSSVGAKTTVLTFYPRKLVTLRTGTAAGGAAGSITLDAGASALDDFYNGCVVVGVLDSTTEVRVITDYVGSTKVASVTPNWVTTPDSDDTFTILLPEGKQIPQADLVAIANATVSTTSAQLGVNVVNAAGTAWNSGAITAGTINDNAIDAASIADNAITANKIATGAITAAKFAAGAIDAAAIATDAIGAAEFSQAAADKVWSTAARVLTAGTNIQLPSNGLANVTAWTVDITGNITGSLSGSVGSVSGAVGSVTGNVGGNVTGSIGSLAAQAKADVNAEVLDVMNTDTFAEPGQGSPGATISIFAKIGYLYKAWRNKSTQTATEFNLFADDGTTVDQKATTGDDGTTFTRGEITTGP